MQMALAEAGKAAALGEVPVGAVLVDAATGLVVATSHNLTETLRDPTAHAEMLVIREACRARQSPRLPACDLYVTLEALRHVRAGHRVCAHPAALFRHL